jgi:hypothetical protein
MCPETRCKKGINLLVMPSLWHFMMTTKDVQDHVSDSTFSEESTLKNLQIEYGSGKQHVRGSGKERAYRILAW